MNEDIIIKSLSLEVAELKEKQELLFDLIGTQAKNLDIIARSYNDYNFFLAREKFLNAEYKNNGYLLQSMAKALYPHIVEKAQEIAKHKVSSNNYVEKINRFGRILYFVMRTEPANSPELYPNALRELEDRIGQVIYVDSKSLSEKIIEHRLLTNAVMPPSVQAQYNNAYKISDLIEISRLVTERMNLLKSLYDGGLSTTKLELLQVINNNNSRIKEIQQRYIDDRTKRIKHKLRTEGQ